MVGFTLDVVVVTLFLQGLSLTAGQTATHASETSLRAALSSGYDQTARPYTPTTIDVVYYLRSVQAVDIAEQKFHHTSLMHLTWHDPRLVWNATDYSNITKLDIKTTWRPMFNIGNEADDIDMIGSDNDVARVTVWNNGSVMWMLGLVSETSCDVNILNFPHDTQECDVNLVFLGNDYGTNLDFNLTYTEINTDVYIKNDEWELLSSYVAPVHVPVCCPQTTLAYLSVSLQFERLPIFYINSFVIPAVILSICLIMPFYLPTERSSSPGLSVSIQFERLPFFYLNSFVIPAVILSVCLIMPFYLPTDSGERLGFALTILLSYTVLLSMTSDFLPTTSRQVPYLGQYLLTVLFMCALSVINVALNVKLFHLTTPPPGYMKTMARKMKPIVFFECCFRPKRGKVADKVTKVTVESANAEKPPLYDEYARAESEASTSTSAEGDDMTWNEVVAVMDRICFYMYTFAILVLNIVLLVLMSAG